MLLETTTILQFLCWLLRYEKPLLTLLMITVNVLDTSGKLIIRPENMVVVSGSNATFHCSSDEPSDAVGMSKFKWYAYKKNCDSSDCQLSVGDKLQQVGRFMLTQSRDRYDLTVLAVQLEDAGLYVCHDSSEHASAHLVVLTNAMPSCFANISLVLGGPQLVEGETVRFTCSTERYNDYHRLLKPRYRWTSQFVTFPANETTASVVDVTVRAPYFSPQRQSSMAMTNLSTCTMYFDRPDRTFSDTATNAPSYRANCIIPSPAESLIILHAPRQVIIETSATSNISCKRTCYAGDVVGCSADGYPPPIYTWLLIGDSGDENVAGTGPMLTLSQPGRIKLRCLASNTIRDVVRRTTSDIISLTVIEKPVSTSVTDDLNNDDVQNRSTDQIAKEANGRQSVETTSKVVGTYDKSDDRWYVIVFGIGGGVIVVIITITIGITMCVIRFVKITRHLVDQQRDVVWSSINRSAQLSEAPMQIADSPQLILLQQNSSPAPENRHRPQMTERNDAMPIYDEMISGRTTPWPYCNTDPYQTVSMDPSHTVASTTDKYTSLILQHSSANAGPRIYDRIVVADEETRADSIA